MIRLVDYITKQDEKLMLEMSRVGGFADNLDVYVRSNDPGNIPHFHIVDSSTLGDEFHTCVQLTTNKYFHHTGKEDVLNKKQRKLLVQFLKSKYKRYGITNWQRILDEWNDHNNSGMNVPDNQEMPNYLTIEDNN